MSNQKDDLKDLFNSAFAAENVEFSPAAWEGMNTMLDQKQSKRGFWLWMSSGLATLLLIAASIPFFLQEGNVYEPRMSSQEILSESVLNINDISLKNNNTPQTNFSNNQTTTNQTHPELKSNKPSSNSENNMIKTTAVVTTSQPDQTMATANAATQSSIADEQLIANAIQNDATSEGGNIGNEPVPHSIPIIIDENESGNDPDDQAMMPATNTTTTQITRSTETLDYLPTLSAKIGSASNIIIRDKEEGESLSDGSKWNHYMISGLTRALNSSLKPYPNWGQRFGIGTTLKLRNHLYLSGELAMARDAVDITTVTTANKYGLTKTVIDQETNTSELLFAEMPILLHYRYNRIKVGGGPMLQYLTGVKNNEIRTTQMANGTVVTEDLQSGYYTWDQFNRFNVGLTLDASYQVGEPIHIGIRNNFGLTNLFSTDQMLRQSRLEFYIKLDLP